MISNAIVLSFLLLGVALIPATYGQITFSRSWVPQGKRSASQEASGERSLEIAGHSNSPTFRDTLMEARREARLAVLAQMAANIADLIEETSQSDVMLALRLRNALSYRERRSV